MKNNNKNVLSAADSLTSNGTQLDFGQIISGSFHAYFGDTNAAGTFKLQGSNDVCIYNNMQQAAGFVVTNWIDIPNQSAAIVAGAAAILQITQNTFKWCRCVYTNTAAGVQTVAPIADTGAYADVTVTCPATAAATQGDYFILYNPAGLSTAFWLDIDSAGTVPTGADFLAATARVKVSIVAGNTAAQVGAALQAAAATFQGYVATDNSDGTVTYVQTLLGATATPHRHAANGTGNGSFAYLVTQVGAASNLNSKYFLLSAGANGINYYVWIDVDSQGVSPGIAGKTAIHVAISAGASAGTIGAAIATAVAAAHGTADFTATGTTTVTITNKQAGSFIQASDVNTGFAIATTVGGSTTINVNANLLSV